MSNAATTVKEGQLPVAHGGGEARDYVLLLKPRVMSLVLFTAFVGMTAAPGALHPVLAFAALLAIAVGAGAAGALNMWYEADLDATMARTRNRPLPAGRLTRGEALAFGLVLAVAAVVFMGLVVNLVAAALLALTIAFYVVVYTMWLKRRTPHNIVIGGAAGAFPPLVGYAAVSGNVTLDSLILFAIIFVWTPPHFWALSLFCSRDYARAGVPMLPVVAGEAVTRRQILAYSALLTPLGIAPYAVGFAGPAYGLVAAALGVVFLIKAWRVWRCHEGAERQLFAFSILYLFLLFATLGGERLVGTF
ncbi:MAG: heme o synthase [Rhodothalassiaceae bacterium]